MRVVSSGHRYEIYDNSLKTYNELPAQVYSVQFHPQTGFYLQLHTELVISEEKIYGVHMKKVEKVLNSFEKFERNLGVILSGDKGIGKSLFAKIVCIEGIKRNLPVIIVNKFYPGIAQYLSEIEQEVIIMFDEFDKTFGGINVKDNEANPQSQLLTLFDGMEIGKKLFIVTCNELRSLNSYLVNRPGRFHYHFRFEYPIADEIKEYMADKLDEAYYGEIEKVIAFAGRVNLNYDCLRAICFELKMGGKFEDIIKDLNIINLDEERYNISVYMSDGSAMTSKNNYIDLFDKDSSVSLWVDNETINSIARLKFGIINCKYDISRGVYVVDGKDIKLEIDEDEFDKKNEKENAELEHLKSLKPLYVTVIKAKEKGLHYAV